MKVVQFFCKFRGRFNEDIWLRIYKQYVGKTWIKRWREYDHPWINKALERAQQKVEARNFDIRKSLLKFDNVLNDQRQVIFSQRKEILSTTKINQFIDKMLDDEIIEIINVKSKSVDLEKDKVLKNKFEILLQNNNQDYINKNFLTNQNELKKAIEEKFIEKRNKEFHFYQRLEIMT